MSSYQAAKMIVRAYFEAMEKAAPETAGEAMREYKGENY